MLIRDVVREVVPNYWHTAGGCTWYSNSLWNSLKQVLLRDWEGLFLDIERSILQTCPITPSQASNKVDRGWKTVNEEQQSFCQYRKEVVHILQPVWSLN